MTSSARWGRRAFSAWSLFTYQVPASAFVADTNTMRIDVGSGSGGTAFLSAGISFDCVELF